MRKLPYHAIDIFKRMRYNYSNKLEIIERGAHMKRVYILTEDVMLYQKIKLELLGVCECTRCEDYREGADVYLVDADCERFGGAVGLTMSRKGECDISLPFPIGSLKARLTRGEEGMTVRCEGTTVTLGTNAVKLTEVEFALFSALYRRGGESATREELIREVWGEGADGGVLNVYVHYLRSKLERGGERVILATRGKGYRINKEYIGGAHDKDN